MAWNNEHVPVVRVQAKDNFSDDLTNMARSLKQSGNADLAEMILQNKARLKENVPKAIEKIGNQEISDVIDLIRKREYNSKSGYKGRGNLEQSIKKEISKDKLSVDIFPTALSSDGNGDQSKDGYEYGQAFENGLKDRNYPAHHPFHDSGMDLDVDTYSDEMIKNSIK